MKNLFIKVRMYYHLRATRKALFDGNKEQYDKHTTMVHKILWDVVNGA